EQRRRIGGGDQAGVQASDGALRDGVRARPRAGVAAVDALEVQSGAVEVADQHVGTVDVAGEVLDAGAGQARNRLSPGGLAKVADQVVDQLAIGIGQRYWRQVLRPAVDGKVAVSGPESLQRLHQAQGGAVDDGA